MAGQAPVTFPAETFDAFTADSVHLRHMMPAEIWKMVCDKLLNKSPSDLENLANSSHFFRNLQLGSRNTYLVEKVFPLVVSTVWKREDREGLPVKEIFKCRTVCSKWSDAIDKLVRCGFQNFGNDRKIANFTEIWCAFSSRIDFTNYTMGRPRFGTSVHKFLRHFEQTHSGNGSNGRSPFIWDDISVDVFIEDEFDEIENCQVFREGISTMLSKYGCHVRGFTLKLHSNQFLDNPSWVWDLLWQMPNLKNLRIINYSDDSDWNIKMDSNKTY